MTAAQLTDPHEWKCPVVVRTGLPRRQQSSLGDSSSFGGDSGGVGR